MFLLELFSFLPGIEEGRDTRQKFIALAVYVLLFTLWLGGTVFTLGKIIMEARQRQLVRLALEMKVQQEREIEMMRARAEYDAPQVDFLYKQGISRKKTFVAGLSSYTQARIVYSNEKDMGYEFRPNSPDRKEVEAREVRLDRTRRPVLNTVNGLEPEKKVRVELVDFNRFNRNVTGRKERDEEGIRVKNQRFLLDEDRIIGIIESIGEVPGEGQ